MEPTVEQSGEDRQPELETQSVEDSGTVPEENEANYEIESGSDLAVSCPGGLLYGVRQGETLFSIAAKFGVTVQALLNANPGINPNNLQVCQIICIPGVASRLCPGGSLTTVRAGQTMSSIAQQFGISLQSLIAANPWIPNPNFLCPGEQLCVPIAAPGGCFGGLLYGVRQGETLFSIAAKFGVTVQALLNANPGINPNNLQVCQIICIPGVAGRLCPNGFLTTVQAGQSMFSIAQQFGVPLQSLIAANPWIPNPSFL
ncbi:MAG: LysM peptidoglycan-binding domain-containing protein, partial [Clostridia bacterium]|nr:LysM peptidoglycan-binding domain-containing protein [Clostridia bacterium]